MKFRRVLLIFLIAVVAYRCGASNPEVVEEDVAIESVETVEETDEVEEVTEEVEESSEELEEIEIEYSREDKINFAQSTMANSFADTGEISYDSNMDALTILPTDPMFSDAVYYVMTGESDGEAWRELVGNMVGLSITISEIVDEDIRVAILNPDSPDRILLLVKNGEKLYDFADEI